MPQDFPNKQDTIRPPNKAWELLSAMSIKRD